MLKNLRRFLLNSKTSHLQKLKLPKIIPDFLALLIVFFAKAKHSFESLVLFHQV